jgi:hypothetical protein
MQQTPMRVPEVVVEQLHRSLALLREMQGMEQTLKVAECVRLLRIARARIYDGLRSLPH